MSKIGTKLILVISLLTGLQAVGQSIYNYSVREYYDYKESKQTMVLTSRDRVGSTLTIDDKKRTILFKISGIKEFATYDNIISKGLIPSSKGKSFLHYVYVGPNNDVLHFYISKESAKIESYGSMLRLVE